MTPSVTQDDIWLALQAFLAEILPDSVGAENIIQAQVNRVPEPTGPDFVLMTPVTRVRLSTNFDSPADTVFVGSISGTALTVTNIQDGTISVGQSVFGTGVAAGTKVVATVSGTGGTGTYTVSPTQTVVNGTLSGGQVGVAQATEVMIQLDVHGPSSGDNSQVITTLMRDEYGVRRLQELSGGQVWPLYADDPRQTAFINEQQQYEDRYVLSCVLQINPVVTIPQEFASVVEVDLLDVDATYPP